MAAIDLDDDVAELKPRIGQTMIAGEMQPAVNIDGLIMMARFNDTPEARLLYRLYRKHRAKLMAQILTPPDRRKRAMLAALDEFGFEREHVKWKR